MKIRHPFLLRLMGFLCACVIRIWLATIRLKLVQLDSVDHPADYNQNCYIYSIWHNSILFLPHFRSRVHVLISQHADGEFITHTARLFRADVIRGSTTRGGTAALLKLIRVKKKSHLLVTPDGPRGPRHQVQKGLIYLASRTGLPIIPAAVGYRGYWQAKSWDRFVLPKPFTHAVGIMGEAIYIPKNLKGNMFEHYRELVEQRMLELNEMAEQMVNGQEVRITAPLKRQLAG